MKRYSPLLLLTLLATGCQPVAAPTAAPLPVTATAPVGKHCLAAVVHDLQVAWPDNKIVNIIAFGHSVPAGFGITPAVHKRDAYPRLLEDALADAYPHAVLNVITAAAGGENSQQGRERFARDALAHAPRVVLIDYGLNDRGLALQASARNLAAMIVEARAAGACPVLLTPTWDEQAAPDRAGDPLGAQAAMIRRLGELTDVPVADSLAAFQNYRGDRHQLMAQFNHPNREGHALVLGQLMPLFTPSASQP
ncbi:lipase [Stenotrophomonas sp. MYb57]|jgi:lysophospholipase L1-like esterase|nr:lipase [Stenotrophomonas sp. MYb57]